MVEKSLCCGCSACYNICPQECITMVPNEEGFLYPHIDSDKCIHCGMCEKVCPPLHQKPDFNSIPYAWGGYSKNETIRKASSSGGIFSLLASKVLSNGGVVFGAVLTDGFSKVIHVGISDIDDLGLLRGSKYVQSDLKRCYSEIRKLLQNGKTVLFSGTFCQIDGLKLFLGKEYDNLITVELICHGTPSPYLFKKYIEEMRQMLGGEIKAVAFRDEIGGGMLEMRIDSTTNSYKATMADDPYYDLFMSNNCLRRSCYQCPSKGKERRADITLSDFWGVESVAQDLVDGGGVSLVLAHTEKGRKLFESIKDEVEGRTVDFNEAIKGNKAFFSSYDMPYTRDAFWNDFQVKSMKQLQYRYCGGRKKQIKHFLDRIGLLKIFKCIKRKLKCVGRSNESKRL